MSRSWQYMGFNPAATAILDETVKVGTSKIQNFDLEGNIVSGHTTDRLEAAYDAVEYARENPWCESYNVLYRYTFRDGRILEGYVQAEPWSSGPCTFMALRDAVTKEPVLETLWSEADINNA